MSKLSNRSAAIAAIVLTLGFLVAVCPSQSETMTVTWDDLLPKQEAHFDDPFEELSEEQLLDLGMVARIRFLLANEKTKPDGPDVQEEKALVAKLSEQGVDVDVLLSQRERVAAERRKRAEAVDTAIDGGRVKIPGYMLPLERQRGASRNSCSSPGWVPAFTRLRRLRIK